ncbi:MAG: DASS family sodium-coupled anion symporter [Spirochaetes bacterium]|nr:DASS family sodium-coupled anion symporter [Spirochaetota bacterium]
MEISNMWQNYKRIIYFTVAVVLFILILLLPDVSPITEGNRTILLSHKGKISLAVMAFTVVLWVTEAVPFPIAGLISLALLTILKVDNFKNLVAEGFGNSIVLFFIGVLILSAAINATSIMKRITLILLYRLGHRPSLIILTFLITGTLLSAWITDMAVAAMLLPLGLGILRNAGAEKLKSNFGKALMISAAWGPLIGGIATPAGCGPNPLTIGFLRDLAGIDFSFLDWSIIGFPAAILMIPFAWWILLFFFPPENITLSISSQEYQTRINELGRITRKEIFVIVIFILTITLWILEPFIKSFTNGAIDYLEISFVAFACACLFFLPGIEVLSWKHAESEISWGGIILIVTGLSLGMAIYKTGAAEWMAYVLFGSIGSLHPIAIVFVITIGVSLMKVMFSSNTVTGIIVVPLLIALAKTTNISPALLAIPAGITSSLSFILVSSTPTNVIPYSSGYFTIVDMAKAGIIMTICASLCVTVCVYFLGNALHLI